MTDADGEATSRARTTVRIPTASGDELDAWLYLPEGDERFCRAGFAAIVFDYRQWGGSDGQPREELSYPRQREDYGTVIGWAAAQPRFDGRRIFAWGTSFAGMYIVEASKKARALSYIVFPLPVAERLSKGQVILSSSPARFIFCPTASGSRR
jgi:predicted acyl esterase